MYKAVIFDLDGTLLDSLPDILSVLNYTLQKFGFPCVTREQAQTYIGNGARELVRLSLGSRNENMLDEVLAFYKEEYAKNEGALSSLYAG
ncbi:MAG: HAD hydrolase-like protein, partial [Clostridia bacterium]|nr:HAD hydrolase-like protein [Clostridia bacterium]